MVKKFVLAFAILALALATAGTVPSAGGSYKITLLQPSVVNGNDLKAGEYRLNLGAEKVTIINGKLAVDVPVKVETADKKFEQTAIRYITVGGKQMIAEIRLGGTTTRLVFNP
jgi:asparagine N-glycosylation enzyme membrane subunit Stt3